MVGLQGMVITGAGALLLGLGGGWKAHSTYTKAKANDALEDAIESHNLQVGILETELKARASENLILSEQLVISQQNVRTEFRTITKEVPKYVPQNTDVCNCDLGKPFIRLFNNAATRNQTSPIATPITADLISSQVPDDSADLAGEYRDR